MPDPETLLAIVRHTPGWVWAVLAALVVVGSVQLFPRRVSPQRAAALPLAMLALSLSGVLSAFGTAVALAGWAAGVLAAGAIALSLGAPQGARWSDVERCFRLPGSVLPLALMLGIFCTRFTIGVQLAQHPDLARAAGFAGSASLLYGAFSGLFAGRAIALRRLARPASRLGAP